MPQIGQRQTGGIYGEEQQGKYKGRVELEQSEGWVVGWQGSPRNGGPSRGAIAARARVGAREGAAGKRYAEANRRILRRAIAAGETAEADPYIGRVSLRAHRAEHLQFIAGLRQQDVRGALGPKARARDHHQAHRGMHRKVHAHLLI